MKAGRVYLVQAIGGMMLTVCLLVYVAQAVPFLMVRSGLTGLPVSEARITKVQMESLSGRLSSRNRSYHIAYQLTDGPLGRTSGGVLDQESYDALGTGRVVSVVSWRNEILLEDDLRWEPRHRRKYWLMLAAAVLFGLETVRRFVLCLGQWRNR